MDTIAVITQPTKVVDLAVWGAFKFDDTSTADVILHLQQDEVSLSEQDKSEDENTDASIAAGHGRTQAVYVHAHVLTQCRYFNALLSDRWQDRAQTAIQEESEKSKPIHINLCVVPGRHRSSYIATLKLLYTQDFIGTIHNVESALCMSQTSDEFALLDFSAPNCTQKFNLVIEKKSQFEYLTLWQCSRHTAIDSRRQKGARAPASD